MDAEKESQCTRLSDHQRAVTLSVVVRGVITRDAFLALVGRPNGLCSLWILTFGEKARSIAARAWGDDRLLLHLEIFIDVFAVEPEFARSTAIRTLGLVELASVERACLLIAHRPPLGKFETPTLQPGRP